MAGDWIKMRTNLDTDVRVIELSMLLEIPELQVVGCLWKLWSWADQNTHDGNAIRVTSVTLDRFTGVTGFAEALRKTGWLEGRDGSLTFPRFTEHNGQTAKSRAETKERVAKHRNTKAVTDVTQKVLPEKRRVEKSIPPVIPQGDPELGGVIVPKAINSERFRAALANWFKVIAAKVGKVDPVSIEAVLAKLSDYSERKAVAFVTSWVATGRYTPNWKSDWEEYQPSECESPKSEELENYGPRVKPKMKQEAVANG